jgi:pyruvate dehydrogenase E1 component beta subunit
MVVRGPAGGGVKLAAQHSQCLEAWFAHVPGLKVVMPSSPATAKGLLASAIADDNPVVVLEPKSLLLEQGDVPDGIHRIELGRAAVVRPGTDVTVIAWGSTVRHARRAARDMDAEGISVEVVDLQSIAPLDVETIVESVGRTGRAVIAHEAPAFGGFGGEVAAQIAEHAVWHLDGPIVRVGAPHCPVPYEASLEQWVLPNAARIADTIRRLP